MIYHISHLTFGDWSDETAMDERPAKRRKVDYSNVETGDINGYRRAVINVFVSHYDRIRSVLKGNMEDFASKALSAHFISSQLMEFLSIFKQFKTGFELCRSISEIQQQYECFIDILLDIGGLVEVAGREIEEELTNLTGK